MASNEDIMFAIGKLQESVERLRGDLQEEKSNARESRSTIHNRLDGQAEEIGKLRTDVVIMGMVDAQVRDEVRALNETVEKNQKAVAPVLAEWSTMKRAGLGLTGLLAIGGLSIGAVLTWAGETAVDVVRHWLRIT